MIELCAVCEYEKFRFGNFNGDVVIADARLVEVGSDKSIEDIISTTLGWKDRRRRFKNELESLSETKCAAVVIEATIGDLLSMSSSRVKKTESDNSKIFHRQLLAWQWTSESLSFLVIRDDLPRLQPFGFCNGFGKKNYKRSDLTY